MSNSTAYFWSGRMPVKETLTVGNMRLQQRNKFVKRNLKSDVDIILYLASIGCLVLFNLYNKIDIKSSILLIFNTIKTRSTGLMFTIYEFKYISFCGKSLTYKIFNV